MQTEPPLLFHRPNIRVRIDLRHFRALAIRVHAVEAKRVCEDERVIQAVVVRVPALWIRNVGTEALGIWAREAPLCAALISKVRII